SGFPSLLAPILAKSTLPPHATIGFRAPAESRGGRSMMADVPATRPSLLVRLRDVQDHAAWGDFVQLYAPAVYHFARRKGLQDADAADLTQDVLRSVMGAIGRLDFDPERGLFRSWLFTLAHRRLCDWLAHRQRHEQPAG